MTIYLYIKQCSHCNLKYFGRTETKDPFKYTGSGQYWKKHLKYYKSSFITIDIFGFDNQDQCTKFALSFSLTNNIVLSDEWANLIDENGIHYGSPKGLIHKETSKTKII